MKKSVLLFINIIIFFSIKSQITITKNNIFNVGDSAIMFDLADVGSEFNPGPEGENVIWDFSDYKKSTEKSILKYIAPSSTIPHIDTMNNCNLVEKLTNKDGYGYTYINTGTDRSKWERIGFYTKGVQDMYFAFRDNTNTILKPVTSYKYPLAYSDKIVKNYGGIGNISIAGIDSLKIEEGLYEMTVDSWGQLNLPHKIYSQALRVKIYETFWIYYYRMGHWLPLMKSEDNTYYWFVEGIKGPVMSFSIMKPGTDLPVYNAKWNIIPHDKIEVDFEADTTGTTIDTFYVTNLSEPLNNLSTFKWEFTPNTVHFQKKTNSTSKHPIITFDEPGKYSCKLIVDNENFTPSSETKEKIKYFNISPEPLLEGEFYVPNNTEVNINETITFSNSINFTEGTKYKWTIIPPTGWIWDNFTNMNSKNPEITFNKTGCYSVQLTATNNNYSNSPFKITKMKYISVGGGCGAEHNITFNITNGVNAIVAARIFINNKTLITNNLGQATTSLIDGTWDYTVKANGFEDKISTITVNGNEKNVDVTLVPKPKYKIVFLVKNTKLNVVKDANISINSKTLTTNNKGKATIELENGNYTFKVNANGYKQYKNTFEIAGEAKEILVPLTIEEKYLTTFKITNGNSTVENAIVAITGQTPITTNSEGKTAIKLSNANYNYTVSATGFKDFNGTFEVNGTAQIQNVILKSISEIKEITPNILISPNPSTGIFTLSEVENAEIEIIDCVGRTIYKMKSEKQNLKIDLTNKTKGVYLVKISTQNKPMKIIIK